MGIEYQHVMMTNHTQAISIEKIAGLLRRLIAEGYINNKELKVYYNSSQYTLQENEDISPALFTTVTDFVTHRYKEIEVNDYTIEIDLFNSVKPDTYIRIFEQDSFLIKDPEQLYGSKLMIISSKHALFPAATEVISDIIDQEVSCFDQLEYRSTLVLEPSNKGLFPKLFKKETREGIQYDSFPFMHLTKETNSDSYIIEYHHVFTNELLKQSWRKGNVIISFDMNKCIPRDGLTKLDMTAEFKNTLKDTDFEIVSEFGSWS